MSKKQLTAVEVLSLITGEWEYPTLSCSSGSEVGEEDVAEIVPGVTGPGTSSTSGDASLYGEHSLLGAEDNCELDAIQNVNESMKENIEYEVLNSSSESEEEHKSSGDDVK